MTNHPDNEVWQLVERARARIEMDERYTRETEESYNAKKHDRMHQIIINIVIESYRIIAQDVIDRIKSILSIE